MRAQIQIALRLGAAFFLLVALALLADPEGTHKVFSTGAFDATTYYILTAAILSISIIMVVMAQNPEADVVGAVAASLILIAVVVGHQMLIAHTVPKSFPTVITLIVIMGLGMFLLLARTQESGASAPATTRPAAKKAPAKKAKKKAAKKKAAKKAKKKAAKKRR
jgi:hypothetical protein